MASSSTVQEARRTATLPRLRLRCSGSVSFALYGGGLLARPRASSGLMDWGLRGRGLWITVYANGGHAYTVIAGLRFDTPGRGESGPRWRLRHRSARGYVARHPRGL